MTRWLLPAIAIAIAGCSTPEEEVAPPPDGEDESFVIAEDSKSDANGVQEGSFDAFCVLNFANSASEADLYDVLHSYPAENVWKARLGADGVAGTDDDGFFETVDQLDDVRWVGYLSFNAMKKAANDRGLCPELGEETLFPGEDAMADEVARMSEDEIIKNAQNDEIARRDAHAKAHGCVRANVTIDNSSLEPSERIGVFAENRTLPAWIRFSNGNPVIQNDRERDARGMAIKLMEVPGEKVLERHRNDKTQDFLLINGPAFFVRTASDYVKFTKNAFDGEALSYFLSLNPLEWKIRELTNALQILLAKPSSPIVRYWSTVPYALGDGLAVKYSAKPCGDWEKDRAGDVGPDYMSETLVEALADGPQCFEFMLQRQLDPAHTPIEDSTIEWDDTETPFVTVATIDIPQQTFLSPEQVDFCENMSFNPWHTLPEHRPLGNINRTRRVVYDVISDLRHELNMEPREEPTGHIVFD